MIPMTLKSLTGIAVQSAVGGAIALAFSAPAIARTSANISVSAGGKIASNPFLDIAGAPSGQALSLEISPFVRIEGASSSLALTSNFRLEQYLKHYGSELAGDVGANFEKRFSGKTSIRAGGSFRSSRTTLRDILQSNGDSIIESGLVSGVLADPTLVGRGQRSNIWQASAGLTAQPTNRDVVSLDFSINQLHRPDFSAQDYRFLSLQASLSHKLSSHTSLQFSLGGGSSKYLHQRAGNGTTITPMAGITTRLNNSFTLTALAGTTISRIDRGDGTKISSTTWAMQANLCKRSQRETFCLTGARNTQPTSFGEVRAITSVNLNYNRQLNAKTSIGASAGLSQGSASILQGVSPSGGAGSTRYITASSTLSHRFNRRFVGFLTPSFDHARDNLLAPRHNYQVNFGLRYIFGELR
jgi:hypothetical protein